VAGAVPAVWLVDADTFLALVVGRASTADIAALIITAFLAVTVQGAVAKAVFIAKRILEVLALPAVQITTTTIAPFTAFVGQGLASIRGAAGLLIANVVLVAPAIISTGFAVLV